MINDAEEYQWIGLDHRYDWSVKKFLAIKDNYNRNERDMTYNAVHK
jgi:hypothetical protein